jgi:hypothetical protein
VADTSDSTRLSANFGLETNAGKLRGRAGTTVNFQPMRRVLTSLDK